MPKHIVVIGGGIAGTSAARSLRSRGYKVTILEKNDRLGGRIRSENIHGAAIEMGAAFVTNSYTNIKAFLEEEGIRKHLYRQHSSIGILKGNKLKKATLSTLVGNDILSWNAKLAAMPLLFKTLFGWRKLDLHALWRADRYDTVTVSEALQHEGGTKLLVNAIDPALNAYFYWTSQQTSLAILLIVIKAMLKGGQQKLTGGLQQIPEKAARGCEVLLHHDVLNVQRGADGKFTITAQDKTTTRRFIADGVVCATTASAVPKIIIGLTAEQRDFFASIRYSSTVVAAQTYPADQTLGDRGWAFVRSKKGKLAAIAVSPEKTTEGVKFATVKAYASGDFYGLQTMSDEAAKTQLLHAKSAYDFAVLTRNARAGAVLFQRWPEALPMFEQGHFRKLRLFAEGKIEGAGTRLVFAGDYLGGPFMEGAFTSGLDAAKRLDAQM